MPGIISCDRCIRSRQRPCNEMIICGGHRRRAKFKLRQKHVYAHVCTYKCRCVHATISHSLFSFIYHGIRNSANRSSVGWNYLSRNKGCALCEPNGMDRKQRLHDIVIFILSLKDTKIARVTIYHYYTLLRSVSRSLTIGDRLVRSTFNWSNKWQMG